MKLLIVRHAKAYDPDADRWPDDSDRPLAAKGARRFTKSVDAIKALAPKTVRVISSPYARALRTAEILCEASGLGRAGDRRSTFGAPMVRKKRLSCCNPSTSPAPTPSWGTTRRFHSYPVT